MRSFFFINDQIADFLMTIEGESIVFLVAFKEIKKDTLE